ncbi:hypothetical protein K474DRAFT_1680808, partial [Panus rudis PR-1116 ss-1]
MAHWVPRISKTKRGSRGMTRKSRCELLLRPTRTPLTDFLSAVDGLPENISTGLLNIRANTGFVGLVLLGGIDPETNRLITLVRTEGNTTSGLDCFQAMKSWKAFEKEWEAFVGKCFPDAKGSQNPKVEPSNANIEPRRGDSKSKSPPLNEESASLVGEGVPQSDAAEASGPSAGGEPVGGQLVGEGGTPVDGQLVGEGGTPVDGQSGGSRAVRGGSRAVEGQSRGGHVVGGRTERGTKFDLERDNNIKANQALLATLGLEDAKIPRLSGKSGKSGAKPRAKRTKDPKDKQGSTQPARTTRSASAAASTSTATTSATEVVPPVPSVPSSATAANPTLATTTTTTNTTSAKDVAVASASAPATVPELAATSALVPTTTTTGLPTAAPAPATATVTSTAVASRTATVSVNEAVSPVPTVSGPGSGTSSENSTPGTPLPPETAATHTLPTIGNNVNDSNAPPSTPASRHVGTCGTSRAEPISQMQTLKAQSPPQQP